MTRSLSNKPVYSQAKKLYPFSLRVFVIFFKLWNMHSSTRCSVVAITNLTNVHQTKRSRWAYFM